MQRLSGIRAIWCVALVSVFGARDAQAQNDPECATVVAPDRRIGGALGDDAFSDVVGVAVDAGDGLYVLQAIDANVRRFDARGRERGVLGGDGEGPGEFRSPRRMGVLGDTLWVVDYATRETLLLDTLGTELGRIGALPMEAPHLASAVLAPLIGGRAVYLAWASDEFVAAGRVPSKPLIIASEAGRAQDTIYDVSTANSVLAVRPPGAARGGLFARQPFGDNPLIAVHPWGRFVVVVERPVASNRSRGVFTVRRFGVDGDEESVRGYEYVPLELTDALIDDYVEERVDWLLAAQTPMFTSRDETAAWVRDALFLPTYAPPVTSALVGTDGRVWVERERTAGGARRWDLLSPQGTVTASLCVAASTQLLVVSGDDAYGVDLDELNVPYVVRFGVEHLLR